MADFQTLSKRTMRIFPVVFALAYPLSWFIGLPTGGYALYLLRKPIVKDALKDSSCCYYFVQQVWSSAQSDVLNIFWISYRAPTYIQKINEVNSTVHSWIPWLVYGNKNGPLKGTLLTNAQSQQSQDF